MNTNTITKLLIVDDKPENLQALEAIIRHEGRQIFQAASGDQALALLLEHEFAMAILDVQMPDMNGFELAEMMRGTEKTRHIPIVFVSAAGKELNYAFKGYETGAVDFLHKPLDIHAVRSKVNVFVALYQQRNESRKQVLALEISRAQQEVLLKELHFAQEELQRAVRMRDDFMSMVAHELRTPLNTLFLETQLRTLQLDRSNTDFFNEGNLRKMVERDRRQIESMVRLIDDMLDVSRIRSGQLSIRRQPTELSSLLQRVVNDLSAQAVSSGSTIELETIEPVTGMWDQFRIEQMLINLLTNALRYGAQKPITVSGVVKADSVHIRVQDRGIGISDENLQRIFAPFERALNSDSSGGLGLGLYITRQLAESHGGFVRVESVVDEGSTFTVVLPLTEASI
ncbi:hybrid sensor histidine kinase/response regulator [Undibacterium sp. Ji42W]|uniref:hybrid sensor histidine kinase/response regulator n=1 Tax=Undibacterium sp. Ji42W TaxID=3413039 RepID=UPI003BF34037